MTTYTLSIIVEGKDAASGPLGRASSALGNIGQIAGGILGAQIFTQIANQIKSFASEALSATASWERLGMSMTSMISRELRNADATLTLEQAMAQAGGKAEALQGWIEKLAINSPFDNEGVATVFRQALTYGFASEQAQRLTQALVDMSAGMGLTNDKMGDVSYALGQINKVDKLLMQDLRQLMQAGAPVDDVLKSMGYSLNDVGKEAISTKDFIEAFTVMMEEDFAGAAGKQAKGWAGILNSMSDIKKLGLREFFSSTFDAIQPLLNKFIDTMTTPLMKEQIKKWGEPLGEFTKDLVNLVTVSGALKTAIKNIKWNEISQELMDGAVGLTKDFELWVDNIDWKKLSDDLEKGIDKIDWAALGVKVGDSAQNIWGGISTSAKEIDWLGIGKSLGGGLNEFLAGITGQGSVQNVIDTWTSNILTGMDISAKITFIVSQWGITIATEWVKGVANVPFLVLSTVLSWLPFVSIGLDTISGLFFTKANEAQGKAVAGLTGGGAKIDAMISAEWKPLIEEALDNVKKTFFNKFQGAVQQAILALVGMTRPLIEAIEHLIEEALGAIVPIVIPVSFGTPTGGNVGGQSTGGGAGSGGAGSGGGTTTIVPQVAGARGLNNFVVPPGFDNDTFPVFASSGEVVNIDQPKSYRNSGSGGGGTVINVEVNIEKVDSEIDIYQMAYRIADMIRERRTQRA